MANVFKSYTEVDITTERVVLSGKAGTEITVIGMTLANTSGEDTVLDIKFNDAYLLKGASVAPGSGMVPIGGEQKIVIGENDSIKVTSDRTIDVVSSVLEKS